MGNLGGGSGCATRSGTLQWMLLNTVPVHTLEEAVEKLNWYTMRWGIEVFHRTLKGGCKIEERQLGSVDRIETCLAIDMVVAWRIQHLTEMSDRDAGGFMHRVFRRRGMEKLVAYTTGNAASPETPPTLRAWVSFSAEQEMENPVSRPYGWDFNALMIYRRCGSL